MFIKQFQMFYKVQDMVIDKCRVVCSMNPLLQRTTNKTLHKFYWTTDFLLQRKIHSQHTDRIYLTKSMKLKRCIELITKIVKEYFAN